MKKFCFIATTALSAVLAITACNRQESVLVIDMGNLVDETITVSYAPANAVKDEQIDTLEMTGNTCTWDRPITQTTRIGIKLLQESDVDVEFLMVPGEKAKVRVDYAFDGAHFSLKGSPRLKIQGKMHERTYGQTREMLVLKRIFAELLAEGVENVDEHYADSLDEVYRRLWREAYGPRLDFIRSYPDDSRSAYYLINCGDVDVFLENYPALSENVREGEEFKALLDKTRERYIRSKALEEAAEKLQVGSVAPDFTATDLEGHTFRLSDFADKYIVLDFWGTWCPWCVKGIPQMRACYEKCGDEVVFIGVSNRDKTENLTAFVAREKIAWRNVQNEENGNPDIVLLYGVSGYPTKVLLAPGLVFKGRYLGEVPEFYEDLSNRKNL